MKKSKKRAVPGAQDDRRYYEAIMCALLRRTGGSITLPAREIADGGNCYWLSVRADHEREAVILNAEPAPELC